jgi:competence protein ComGC
MAEVPPPLVPPPQGTSGKAVSSLIFGIIALPTTLVCIGSLFGLVAVILGHLALGQIKKASGLLGGQGMAVGGLICGYLSIAAAVVLVPILAALAVPAVNAAMKKAKQAAATHHLQATAMALHNYAIDHEGKLPPDLEALVDGGYVEDDTSIYSGYEADKKIKLIYEGAGKELVELSSDAVIMRDRSLPNGELRAYASGHVEFVKNSEPPPAASR